MDLTEVLVIPPEPRKALASAAFSADFGKEFAIATRQTCDLHALGVNFIAPQSALNRDDELAF
jgi:hypothetical protein